MSQPRPDLPGVDPADADRLARALVLSRRRAGRDGATPARLDVVAVPAGGSATTTGGWTPARGVVVDLDLAVLVLDRLLAVPAPHVATARVVVWSRPGPHDLADGDLRWYAALRHRPGGTGAGLLVVTHQGWRTPADGRERRWVRLRGRSG